MSHDHWTQVDDYITDRLVPSDAALEHTLKANAEAGLPPHDVSATQAKFLMLIAQLRGAKRILEIGTLGGYSTIWFARAVGPEGLVVTLESNEKHAEVARSNIAGAGLSDRVEVRLGKAMDSLAQLHAGGKGPFDMIFIDADKPNNPGYLEWSLKLSRPGTVIVADNVIRDGAITDQTSTDDRVQGVQRFFDMLSSEPRLSSTALQTVGSKGYDGFSLSMVIDV